MELKFIRLEESHTDPLAKIMERAFDEDTKIHLGREKGGVNSRIRNHSHTA